ncbi:MAG: FKBP-type peptidyl-prolyl cis-trans isomerase [Flavipsychrobacter sp.]|nr:FKBP-type peptidyl-prolyl cis-trans isomerase [Flavipsychrobacter sp.]
MFNSKLTKLTLIACTLGACNVAYAQNGNKRAGFTYLPNGLSYRIVKDAPGGRNPVTGDLLRVDLRGSLDDSLLVDSRKDNGGKAMEVPMMDPAYDGDIMTGIRLMTAGDSAVFYLSVDTLVKRTFPQGGEIPAVLQGKKELRYEVTLYAVSSPEEAEKEREAAEMVQLATDDKKLQDYFSKNKLKPKKTASGLYYLVTTEGTGETIKSGQTASVKYIGTTLDNKVFDANMGPEAKRTEPLEVAVGQGMVIRGWDEGLQLLKKGTKAKLFIPSPLAYGATDMGELLKPYSILVFEVVIEDVK